MNLTKLPKTLPIPTLDIVRNPDIKDSVTYKDGYLRVSQFFGIYPDQPDKDSSAGLINVGYLAMALNIPMLLDCRLWIDKPVQWFSWSKRKESNQLDINSWNYHTLSIIGDPTLEDGPTIQLMDGADGFGDVDNPRPILQLAHYMVNTWDGRLPGGNPKVLGIPDRPYAAPKGTRRNSSLIFNADWRYFCVKTGNNPGAVGVSMSAAQGAMLQEIDVYAEGGYAGFGGIPGRNYGANNCTVYGGRHAVIIGPEVGAGGAGETLVNCTFVGQERETIKYRGLAPLNFVGCFIKKDNGPIITTQKRNGTAYNTLSFTDCIFTIENDNGEPLFDNRQRKTMSLQNCYSKGVKTLVELGNDRLEVFTEDWVHIDQFVYRDSRSQGKDNFRTHLVRNNKLNTEDDSFLSIIPEQAPPDDLISQHAPLYGIPAFVEGCELNAIRFTDERIGGDPDNTPEQNDEAIARAFELCQEEAIEYIFFPRFGRESQGNGHYKFSKTIELPPGIKLLGATFGYGACLELVKRGTPTEFTPVVRTSDAENAQNAIAFLSMEYPNQFEGSYGMVHWRGGYFEQLFVRGRQAYAYKPASNSIPFRNVLITGKAFGKVWGHGNDQHIDWAGVVHGGQGDQNCSIWLDGVSHVHLYFVNFEGSKKDKFRFVDLMMIACDNIAVYGGIKREATKGVFALIGCKNILITSVGAMRETPQEGLLYIDDSTDVWVGPALVQTTLHGHTGELLTVRKGGNKVLSLPYAEGFAFYADGILNREALKIPVMPTVTPPDDDDTEAIGENETVLEIEVEPSLTLSEFEGLQRYGLVDGKIAPKEDGWFLHRGETKRAIEGK